MSITVVSDDVVLLDESVKYVAKDPLNDGLCHGCEFMFEPEAWEVNGCYVIRCSPVQRQDGKHKIFVREPQ